MRELLERWSRLEPERCMSGPPTTNICVSVRVGDGLHDDTHAVVLDRPSAKQRALLLAAVIEAIETRGWLWRYDSSLKWACVWGQGIRGEKNRRGGDLPAALLGAYLAALEAEVAQ